MSRSQRIALGIIAANYAALAIILVVSVVMRFTSALPFAHETTGIAGIYIMSTFTLVPILMGFILEWIRSPLDMRQSHKIGVTLLSLVFATALSTTILREGVICLIMASPLVLLFHALGVHIAYHVYRHRNGRLEVSVVPILLLLIAGDALSPHQFRATEADTIVIHARPDVVWRYIVGYPANPRPADYWLWRMGLPAPIQSTAPVPAVGARRTCAFTGGVAAEERITEIDPARTLAFDVVKQPDHPEAVGHFNLDRGRFDLHNNGDGTTTVVGTSWYSLRVFPAAYYDL
ncbi:MAG TPA: SRPBCC family protein, partial [Chthonomonadaceae bacterium]|nr:SRPBCC family protein [Chthonomonadaceae bacterium]